MVFDLEVQLASHDGVQPTQVGNDVKSLTFFFVHEQKQSLNLDCYYNKTNFLLPVPGPCTEKPS
jgi:hypothetical protein